MRRAHGRADTMLKAATIAGFVLVAPPALAQSLSLAMSAPGSVAVGSQLTYTITATNNSAAQATNVTVTDILPPGVGFVSGVGCVPPNGNTVTCSIGTIGANGFAQLLLTVSAPSTAGSITNVAGVVSDQVDLSPQDNWATASTTVTTTPTYGCTYGVSMTPAALAATQTTTVLGITLTNTGTLTWPAGGNIRLSYHWYQGATQVVWEGARTLLPTVVSSGQTITLAATLTAPTTPGTYTLEWDMVYEGVTWFSGQGVPTANRTVWVPPAPTARTFHALTPCHVFDTRNPNGPLGGPALPASGQRTFPVGGACGIPSNAAAIAANLTLVPAVGASGNLQIFPGNGVNTGTAILNFSAGLNRENDAIVMLATDGSGTIVVVNASAAANDLVLDVYGYYQ